MLGSFVDKIQKIEYHGWLSNIVAEAMIQRFGHMRSFKEAELMYSKYKLVQITEQRNDNEKQIEALAKKISTLNHAIDEQKKLKD